MKRNYCTYFNINYLIKGIALIESLEKNEKKEYTLFVICMDELTQTFLSKMNYKSVELIPFSKIENSDRFLLKIKNTRSHVEYLWTAKSSILMWLINEKPEIEAICYIDADIFFFNSPDPIWTELINCSVLIHEHRFSEEYSDHKKYGKFNAGFVCFKTDHQGLKVLKWWRERSLEWCYDRIENNKFADQLYLETFQTFNGVDIVKHTGVGVAPWNHTQYSFTKNEDGQVHINDNPIIFYHYHSLITVEPGHIILSSNTNTSFSKDMILICFIPYLDTLYKAFNNIFSIQHDFSYGIIGKDMISNEHTFMAHKSISNRMKSFNLPHEYIPLNENWDCFAIKPFHTNQQFSPDLALNLVEQELLKGNMANALKMLMKIIEKWPDYSMAYNTLGNIHWKSGDEKQAFTFIKKAYDLDPSNILIVKNLRNILLKLKAT